MLSVFSIVTRDGWSKMMYSMINADYPTIALLYCGIIIVLGSFFILYLILAVLL